MNSKLRIPLCWKVLLTAPRIWWMVLAAALPAHLLAELQGGVPVAMVLSWFVSNSTEALIGAGTVRLLIRSPFTLGTLRSVSAFLVAAVAASFLSSFLDSAFVALNGWGRSGYWEVWRTRLLSNVTASLIFVPLMITWHDGALARLRTLSRARRIEGAVLLVLLVSVTVAVFDLPLLPSPAPALICIQLPFMLWAALRFGPVGASTCFAITAFMVIWGTGHGLGPLSGQLPAENALSVQLFLIFIGPALLCLAAAIGERQDAEQSLRASDRRFQLVLQATKDVVYEHDLRNDAMWWGRNGLAPFGYARDDCPPGHAGTVDLVHPEDRERMTRAAAATIESGEQLWECEFRLRRRDGTYAHVHEQGFVVRDATGRALQAVVALTDITERRDIDELSQRLAQASRLTAMGELTASIAHEINQPMSAILCNVDAAEMLIDAGDAGNAELRQILADIRADDLRVCEVVRHLRELANKRPIAAERFDPNALAEVVLNMLGPTMKRRGVRVRTSFEPVPEVWGDRITVQQVLLNLLINGMEAMAAMPERERRLQVSTRRRDANEVIVSVRDRGHGVAERHLDQIFESFFTTKKEGLGLGLSISRTLVEANGGRIWAENNPDRGATFQFTLRVDPAAAAGAGGSS